MLSIFGIVDKHQKKLMWLPLIALVISIMVLANTALTTGFILERDVELTGGKQISVTVRDADIQALENAIPGAKVQLISGITKTLQISLPYSANETQAIETLKTIVNFEGEPTVRTIGPVLGAIFFQQAVLAFVVAFILMAIVVFAIFRSPVPSGIVILSVIVDIGITLGIMNVLHIELSLPVIAALLTLIGYSVDTDILLTTNMLRSRELQMFERITNGMKTGLVMTATTLAALVALYFIAGSFVLERIALVLIIGLIVDVFATWFTNAGILRLYMERKNR
ncbi:MAG: protein translocase subunit SecF [Candidatus Aenigmarchaeota archaeon]|nr:protein translocase subunit SecF [Candidatus Aenigmarchaeota archaeon]